MQKFVDLKSLGTKLQIISAFAVERIKGFIFIEADKQYDVNEVSTFWMLGKVDDYFSVWTSAAVPIAILFFVDKFVCCSWF